MVNVGKYHTNEEGKTLPCTAGIRTCHFIHGDSAEEANELWQKSMEESLIPEAAVKTLESKRLRFYELQRKSLKELNDGELAEAIILEAEDAGWNVNKMSEAIALASELHGDQFRKGNRGDLENPPYIEHPLRNSLRLIRLGVQDYANVKSEEIVIAAVLHDVVEDGSATYAKALGWSRRERKNEVEARKVLSNYIIENFGPQVNRMVLNVTNEFMDREESKALSPSAKHEIYANHMEEKVVKDPGSYLVKLSDFIDNATGLYHNVATMDSSRVRNQANKYLLALPLFERATETLELPLPQHSKSLVRNALVETKRRLKKIADGWDGSGRI